MNHRDRRLLEKESKAKKWKLEMRFLIQASDRQKTQVI